MLFFSFFVSRILGARQSTICMANSSDRSDVSRCSHEQFIRLFLQAERELLRYVMVLVPNTADARDIVQEAAVALWGKIDQYDVQKPFAAWASRFALNEARMFLRTQRRRTRYLADDVVELLQETRLRRAERLDDRRAYLGECLDGLPPDQRELIRAQYFDEMRASELSERFGRSTEAVYKALQRIRRSLHDCIEHKMAAEVPQ